LCNLVKVLAPKSTFPAIGTLFILSLYRHRHCEFGAYVLMVVNMMFLLGKIIDFIVPECVEKVAGDGASPLKGSETFIVGFTASNGMDGHQTVGFLVTLIQTVNIFRSTAG